jgi:hypothetical protein
MKANGYYDLSDVPHLLERGRIIDLLGARGALVDAAEEILNAAVSEERALKGDEQRRFDAHTAQVREINTKLAEYKRQRIADIVAAGLPVDYCRVPF